MSINLKSLIFSTCVICSYLFVEWIYNQHLLVILAYDVINPEDFEKTEIFGKIIASLGLNLIVSNFFKNFSFVRFVMGCVIAYMGLTSVFNYAINAFSDEFRYSSYYSMLYRKEVINQEDKLKILEFSNNRSWYEKSLVISQFFYVLKDEQWKNSEIGVKKPIYEKIEKLNKNRIKYYKDYKKYNASYEKIMSSWVKYSEANTKYSKFRGFFQETARKKFIKQTGLPPDLSLENFIKRVAPEYERASNIVLLEGNKQAGIESIYVKSLPKEMDEITFNNYIDEEVKRISVQIAPEILNIRENKKSFDSLAVLIVPPISICLSLFSIVLNAVILISQWTYYFFKVKGMSCGIFSMYFVTTLSFLIFFLANMNNTLTETDKYWNEIREENHVSNPILFSIFSIGIKLEPFICITKNEPEFIKRTTEYYFEHSPT